MLFASSDSQASFTISRFVQFWPAIIVGFTKIETSDSDSLVPNDGPNCRISQVDSTIWYQFGPILSNATKLSTIWQHLAPKLSNIWGTFNNSVPPAIKKARMHDASSLFSAITLLKLLVCFARLSYTILQRKSTHLCAWNFSLIILVLIERFWAGSSLRWNLKCVRDESSGPPMPQSNVYR